MTNELFEKGLFYSKSVSEYVVELNKKYPNMTSQEFLTMLDEWMEKNKENIIEEANERIISQGELLEEGFIDDDDDDDDSVESTETKPDGPSSDEETSDEEGEKKSKVTKVEKTYSKKLHTMKGGKITGKVATITKKRKDLDADDERFIVVDGIKKKLLVNNPKDIMFDIHANIDAWYETALETGENLLSKTRLEHFVTTDVESMDALFAFTHIPNVDLSSWDTSNVTNMEGMFYHSTFNNPSILEWNVGSCVKFTNMFVGSRFSYNIDNWEPGCKYETVKDADGNPILEYDADGEPIMEIGPDGKPTQKKKKRKVSVKLPEVGARKLEIESDMEYDLKDSLKSLGEKGKVKEEEEFDDEPVEENKKHVLTIEEFVNEGLYDNIKKGIKRGIKFIKEKFNAIGVKINNFFVANVSTTTGTLIPATDPVTSINYITIMKPKGVTAFVDSDSPLLVDGVESEAKIEERSDRYGWIKKGTREYNNHIEFIKKVTDEYMTVSEARVPLNAGPNFNIGDISTKQLEKEINRVMRNVPGETGKDNAGALCIYGAPGIGKTSIPKKIINEWNKNNPDRKKAIIVIECGDLELGGFNIPMPKETELSETIIANKELQKKLLKHYGSAEELERIGKMKLLKTHESPKTWLPVYYKNTKDEDFYAAQLTANGRNLTKLVEDTENGGYVREKIDTTEGGIIMFDEFLRADPELFKTICQLVMNRSIGHGEYLLGDKWGIILCSNRPADDTEVADRYELLPPAMSNRYLAGMYNFIPDFGEWLDWARTDGHFDEDTIEFLSDDVTPVDNKVNRDEYKDSRGKTITTYKNWHTIDPDKFKSGQEPIITTPRGWAALMDWVDDEKRILGVDSIFEIDMDDLRDKACGVIGKEIGNAYVDFMLERKKKYESGSKPKTRIFFNSILKDGEVDPEKYKRGEALPYIAEYVRNNFGSRHVLTDPDTDNMLYNMAVNLDNIYGRKDGVLSTDIKNLHVTIVQDIYRLKYKSYNSETKNGKPDDESKPLVKRLVKYLTYVCNNEDKDGNETPYPYSVNFILPDE